MGFTLVFFFFPRRFVVFIDFPEISFFLMYISVLQFYNCSGNLKYPRICSVRGGIDTKRSALPV